MRQSDCNKYKLEKLKSIKNKYPSTTVKSQEDIQQSEDHLMLQLHYKIEEISIENLRPLARVPTMVSANTLKATCWDLVSKPHRSAACLVEDSEYLSLRTQL